MFVDTSGCHTMVRHQGAAQGRPADNLFRRCAYKKPNPSSTAEHPGYPDVPEGLHLYGSCQAAVRLSDNPASSQARAELASSTYYFGYIGGYIDGLNRLADQVCVRGAGVNTVARVYVAYMQQNPKLMDEGRALGLLLALKNGYACY